MNSSHFKKGHTPWSKGLTKADHPSLKIIAEKVSNAQKGVSEREEVKKQTSKIMKQYYKDNPEKGKLSRRKQLAKRWLDPNQQIKASQRMIELHKNPEYKKNISLKSQVNWQNIEYAKKVMHRRDLNTEETRLFDIIKELNLPYFYSGTIRRGKIIGGKIPDFTHYSENKVIELFGEFWHPKSDEEKRINHFNQNNYKCLIIWASELKNKKTLIEKLCCFEYGGSL